MKGFKNISSVEFWEFWLPSLILITVALVQIFLTQTANLSPWKGAGFGMFAAVDAPGMRVIIAEGLDEEGQLLRLDIFDALDGSTRRRLLALARQKDLENIAPQLISQPIVPTTIHQQATYEKLLVENSNLRELTPPYPPLLRGGNNFLNPNPPLTPEKRGTHPYPLPGGDSTPNPIGDPPLPPLTNGGLIESLSLPLYRLKTNFDPTLPAAMKNIKAVRLQWWKIKFNQREKRIFAEPLSQLVEAGDWQ